MRIKLLMIATLVCVSQAYNRHYLNKRANMPGRWCYSCEYDRENAGNGPFSHSCPNQPIHATALVGTAFCSGDRDLCGRKVFSDKFNKQKTIWLGCVSDDDHDECKSHMAGSPVFDPNNEYKEIANECSRCNTDLCNAMNLNVVHYKIDELPKEQRKAVVPANRSQRPQQMAMGGDMPLFADMPLSVPAMSPMDMGAGPANHPHHDLASNEDMPVFQPAMSAIGMGSEMQPMGDMHPSDMPGPGGLPHVDSHPSEESGPADVERA